ncbi:MAG: hypothetical protein Q4G09_05155 [Clostridia bacterium]|nr:hypothetical protein [Clostridia bacterium]
MEEKLNMIPVKSNIRIKKKDDDYVIFNLETSGFHRITSDVNEILEKLDEKMTIKELADYFAQKRDLELDKFQEELLSFFNELEIRKIIKFEKAS